MNRYQHIFGFPLSLRQIMSYESSLVANPHRTLEQYKASFLHEPDHVTVYQNLNVPDDYNMPSEFDITFDYDVTSSLDAELNSMVHPAGIIFVPDHNEDMNDVAGISPPIDYQDPTSPEVPSSPKDQDCFLTPAPVVSLKQLSLSSSSDSIPGTSKLKKGESSPSLEAIKYTNMMAYKNLGRHELAALDSATKRKAERRHLRSREHSLQRGLYTTIFDPDDLAIPASDPKLALERLAPLCSTSHSDNLPILKSPFYKSNQIGVVADIPICWNTAKKDSSIPGTWIEVKGINFWVGSSSVDLSNKIVAEIVRKYEV